MLLLLCSPALAVTEPTKTYTSTTDCSTVDNKTTWTCTDTCTVVTTVGGNLAANKQSGVQYSPRTAGPPTVTITDEFGQPILVNGAPLSMVPSAAVTSKVTAQYGTISPNHAWSGFVSDLAIDPPDIASTSTVKFIVTYSWQTVVDVQGAVWFSNDGDDLYGEIVLDAFESLPNAFTLYGSGLSGTGDIAPRLNGSGYPAPGSFMSLNLDGVVGGAPGALLVGFAPASFPFKGGSLLVLPIALQLPLLVGGASGNPAAGTLSLPVALPNDPFISGLAIYMQAAFLDGGALNGVSLTQGLEMLVG